MLQKSTLHGWKAEVLSFPITFLQLQQFQRYRIQIKSGFHAMMRAQTAKFSTVQCTSMQQLHFPRLARYLSWQFSRLKIWPLFRLLGDPGIVIASDASCATACWMDMPRASSEMTSSTASWITPSNFKFSVSVQCFCFMSSVYRLFGAKCFKCGRMISPADWVRKAKDQVREHLPISAMLLRSTEFFYPAVHYGVKRTETHFDLCLNFILGQKVANKKSRGKYFK